MNTMAFASKTLDPADLAAPAVAAAASALRGLALRLGAGNVPFAVNGVLKPRVWVRRHKMWEYARAAACVLHRKNARRGAAEQAAERPAGDARERRKFRVLDFGGGATLPVFYLAANDCEVWSLDVDESLTQWSNRVARQRGWRLRGLTHDLTAAAAPAEWGQFDAVISCSVLEHIPQAGQRVVLGRLGALLKPRGVLAVSFDYGEDAPVENAVRSETEVAALVAASGLQYAPGDSFRDTGARYALDKRHPQRKFTFASLFLLKG
jgi:2-polyprenyl-3-methyl-5-hydroxy-6-metoxy-1,4-benzoquinol methylase